MEYLIVLAACALGSGLNIVCGFGMGVFCMMFLPYVMGSTMEAAALVNIVTFVQACIFCFKYRRHINFRLLLAPTLVYFLASRLTVHYAAGLENHTMKMLLGGFMLILSVYFLFIAKRVHIQGSIRNGAIAGGLGGIMSGMFSIGGPPISLYFSSATDDKQTYLATIQTYYVMSNAYVISLRAAKGFVTEHVLFCSVAGLVGMALGSALGNTIFQKLRPDRLRKAMYSMMAIVGIVMLVEP